MSATIHRADYFYAIVEDRPGEGHRLLAQLAQAGVDLLAFNAFPMGGVKTQFMLFPASAEKLVAAAEKIGLSLTGPQRSFLIQGDDRLGAFADIHRELAEAGINVYSANGVTDGRGGFGYILHVRPEDYEAAAHVLDKLK